MGKGIRESHKWLINTFKPYRLTRKTIIFLQVLLFVFISARTYAYDVEVDGIYYYLDSSSKTAEVTYKTTAYNSYTGSVTIPEKFVYEGVEYAVTSIGMRAFRDCGNLTSVTIPNTVISIGDYAFAACSLEDITIPNSVTSIGNSAFEGCISLMSFIIPDRITSIGDYTFYKCISLRYVTIPNSVVAIGDYAFAACSKMAIVTIPNSVTSIGNFAFGYCNGLTSISIPNSVTSIGNYAFEHCRGLTSITIPNSVTSIGNYAFYDCLSLSTVISNIKKPFSIDSGTFGSISGSAVLYVPKGTKSSYQAFSGWTSNFTDIIEGSGTQYSLSITASGNGSVSYSSTLIRNKTTSFAIDEGSSATITFTPDDGYRIASVKVGSTDVTSQLSNNKYIISNITANTTVTVMFEAVPSSTIGTESNPYNVSQAHVLIQSLGADVESEEICVKGFISQIDNISPYPETAYGNATYWISDVKGSTAGQLEVYRGYSIGGEKFTSKDEIKEGDEVVVKGKVVNYRGNTPEFTSGSIIYSLNGQTATEKPVPEFWGTLDEPITVSKAVELINALEDGGSTEKEAYVKGKITAIKTTDENIALYKNIDYIISDGTRELTVFRGKNLNNTDFSEAGQINVGDEVVVFGKLTKYVNNGNVIPEVAQGNYIVKFTYKSEGSTCQLTISTSGSGSVIFNGTTIRDKATSFTVNEGSSVTITFTPDNGYRIASVQMGNTDVTSSIRNNTYTISNITSNTTMSVVFEEREKAISLGDMNYTVTSFENHTLSLARGVYIQVLTVPATVDYENETFTVTGMDADALTDAAGLAAIIWNPEAAFTGQVSNSNLLLYVNNAEYAPSSIKNVVVNGTAASITLVDAAEGNDFYCPEEFTAQRISYAHRYDMITGLQESGGWETIALPFDVEQITHSSKGTLVPFMSWNSNGVTKPFWLYEYGAGGFRQASAIHANTPYIISMPNNDKYLSEYKVNGTVTFSAENVKVLKTEDVHPAINGSYTFVPNFMRRESNDGCYALNVKNDYVTNSTASADGSMFVRNSRAVLPFEAYMTTQTANAREFIPVFEDVPTGIKDVQLLDDRVQSSDAWYTLDGRKLNGKPAKSGVYIFNGKKAVVR